MFALSSERGISPASRGLLKRAAGKLGEKKGDQEDEPGWEEVHVSWPMRILMEPQPGTPHQLERRHFSVSSQSMALLSIFPVCAVSYIQEPARLRVSWGAEKSLVEGAKQQSGQTLGLEGPPQSNRRREEGTGIWCPQARRLPGSKERETDRETDRESALRACALGTAAWQSDSQDVSAVASA